jgi:hypothetical protein
VSLGEYDESYKIRLWAVIGDANTGKSTAIGHLTSQLGRGDGGIRQVLLRGGGYLTLFARRMAWQEAKRNPREVVKLVNQQARRLRASNPPISSSWFNVLCALRVDAVYGFPAGHEYLSHFVEQGWELENLVVMSPDQRSYHYHRFGAPMLELHDSAAPAMEIGWMVGQIRNHFGWAS